MKLSEVGTLKNGINYTKQQIKSQCKIIGVGDFSNNVFPKYSTLNSIESSIISDDFLLEEGDIIFVRSNGNKNLVGRSMYINRINENVTFSGFCIRFRPNKEIVDPLFLFYLLRSPSCRKQYSYSQQTNITNLSQDVLGDVIFDLPTMKDQKKYAGILYDIDSKIENNFDINDNLLYQFSMAA